MSTHQSSAGGADQQPTIRLVPNTLPVSIPLFRLRSVSFLQSPQHPSVQPDGNEPSIAITNNNNNNYDFYKPPITNGLELLNSSDKCEDEHAQIKLETNDCELTEPADHRDRPGSSETGSSYGNQDSRSPPLTAGSAGRQQQQQQQQQQPLLCHSLKGDGELHEEAEPEEVDEEDDYEDEEEEQMVLGDEPGEESNDTAGAAEMDDSEQDDNKLAPQDQEKMTQAVKKVFTEYKWTPPVAPIR
uniref:Uncharacterized protein n=1 Tax=Anopheles christyi TaxID=43041 RepID=A0A182K592_9DIPT